MNTSTAKTSTKASPKTSSETLHKSASAYVPGVCNINTAEIASRRKAGYIGLILFIVLAAPLLLLDLPRLIRILLFLPAFVSAIGFLQAYYKFCVGYGAAGKQNATDGDKEAQDIIDAAAKDLDQKRTRKINTEASVIAGLVTLLVAILT